LDYLRLLYWVFFFPQALRWYLETFADPRHQQGTGRDLLLALREDPVQRRLVSQSLLLGFLLATLPPILVTVVHPHRVPNALAPIAVVAAGGVCTVLIWAVSIVGGVVTGTRTVVWIDALIGLVLCVESVLLPYSMLAFTPL
jgi:hypothetical protein